MGSLDALPMAGGVIAVGLRKYKRGNDVPVRSLARVARVAFRSQRCHRQLARGRLLVTLQSRVTFEFLEVIADFFACHLQGSLESPALPSEVQCRVCQQSHRDVSDEAHGI